MDDKILSSLDSLESSKPIIKASSSSQNKSNNLLNPIDLLDDSNKNKPVGLLEFSDTRRYEEKQNRINELFGSSNENLSKSQEENEKLKKQIGQLKVTDMLYENN